MSTSVKWIIGVVLAAVVLGAIWYVWNQSQSSGYQAAAATGQSGQTQTSQQSSTLQPGNSDADLNADLTQIDAQMQSAESANASAQTFTDTPVPQSQ